MKFNRKEIETFHNNSIVRYIIEQGNLDFEISASRHGIMMKGDSPLINSEEELNQLAETVAKAWQEFLRMRRKENGISVGEEK